MAELLIKPGVKMQMAFDVPVDKTPDFCMMVTFQKALDDAFFLISAPVVDGNKLPMDENQKMLLQYSEGGSSYIVGAYPEGEEKLGIRTCWKMRQVAEQRTFFQRKDERVRVQMPITYLRDGSLTKEIEDGLTMDISAGGLATFMNDHPDVGEAVQVFLPDITLDDETFTLPEQLGIVCWVRETPKGSLYRRTCGLQFRYANEAEREQVMEYIQHVRDKYKV